MARFQHAAQLHRRMRVHAFGRYLRASIPVLVIAAAAPTMAENALSKIADALKQPAKEAESARPALPDAQKAYVVTIDGIHVGASLFNTSSKRRFNDSYLQDKVAGWGIAAHVAPIGWSGNFDDADADTLTVKNGIMIAYGTAKNQGRKLVITAHSWGSVLAYRALRELKDSGKLPSGAVHTLATFGSPLNRSNNPRVSNLTSKQSTGPQAAYDQTVQSAVDIHARWVGPQALDGVVQHWNNYWVQRDTISGPIDTSGINKKLTHIGLKAHQSYYNNSHLSQTIAQDIAHSLTARSPAIAQNPAPVRTPTPKGTPSGGATLDILGVRIGDSTATALSALRKAYPGIAVNKKHSSILTPENKHPAFIRTKKVYCADNAPDCVSEILLTDYKGGFEEVRLKIRLIEDYPAAPGTSIVYAVVFTHEYGRKGQYFDPLAAATRKYGQPISCNNYGKKPSSNGCPSGARGMYWIRPNGADRAESIGFTPRKTQYTLGLQGSIDFRTRTRAINVARQQSNKNVSPF